MIVENGVVRTMDPSLPTTAALAIAGDRVVGGVGVHEHALPTPDRVDLGGRCVLPAFTDAHVHFPTWSLARRDLQLEGVASLSEALARVEAHPRQGDWIRGRGWRDALWDEHPTREALDAVTGATPAALWSKDYHSLWLNSAALARAGGDLDVHGGVVERDAAGEPTGILREESAWRFREPSCTVSEDEYVAATREGIKVANARGVAAIHDKDGWLGANAIFARIHGRDGLTLRVWQSLPHDHIARARGAPAPARARRRLPAARLPEGVHGRHARLADGVDARRERRVHHERRGARRDRPSQRPPPAGRWPSTRSATARTARRSTRSRRPATCGQPLGLRQRIEHAQCVDPADLPRFAELGVACSVQFSHAPSDRDLAERFWGERLDGTYAFGTLLASGAVVANGSDAPVEELDPLAGIAAGVLRTIDDRPAWRADEALTVEQALHASTVAPAWLAGDERRRGKLLPGFLADLVVLDRDPVGCPADELPEIQVVATMVGGRWVHNPPPWD